MTFVIIGRPTYLCYHFFPGVSIVLGRFSGKSVFCTRMFSSFYTGLPLEKAKYLWYLIVTKREAPEKANL